MAGVFELKSRRQEMILELIRKKICLTQEDLQEGLLEAGFDVTQSTVSRDIRELKLVKGRDEHGNYRYLSNADSKSSDFKNTQLNKYVLHGVKSVVYALNNVVVKCNPGMASGACVVIDEIFGDMMLGSLAGDDTIIIVTSDQQQSQKLCENIKNIL